MADAGERRLRMALLAVVGVAAALRLATALDGLWLDEIWSLHLARQVRTPTDILRVHSDNNHPLNTFWLSLAPGGMPDVVYRLPAWLASAAVLLLAAAIARRELAPPGADAAARRAGRAAALIAAGALGFSHLFVHYGPEARGYSLALAFALASYFAAQRGLDRRASGWAILHGLATSLALLAHPLAIHAFAAVLVWSALHLLRREPLRAAAARFAWWHAVPLLFTAAYAWFFLRRLAVAGGPPRPLATILESAACYATGLPHAAGALALALVVGSGLVGIVWLARRGSDAWAFYAVGIFGAPAALLAGLRPELLFERYFLVNLALWLLLASLLLAPLANARGGRLALAALGACYLVGNGARTADLLRVGRGGHAAAVRYVYEHTAGEVIRFGSDPQQRLPIVLGYYAERLPHDKRWEHVGDWRQAGADWLFLHDFEAPRPRQQRLRDRAGRSYALERTWPYAGLSGWHLFLYRRVDDGPRDRSGS